MVDRLRGSFFAIALWVTNLSFGKHDGAVKLKDMLLPTVSACADERETILLMSFWRARYGVAQSAKMFAGSESACFAGPPRLRPPLFVARFLLFIGALKVDARMLAVSERFVERERSVLG